MRTSRRWGAWSFAALGFTVGLACELRPNGTPDGPVCECKCECPAVTSPVATKTGPTEADIGELMGSAVRKMNHDDGAGCLADLDQLDALDPKQGARQAMIRGQCEMLAGKCQQGKQRVMRWYQDESNMQPDRALVAAEALASMRCREGDSDDRDRLMRALYDLSDGAYMNRRAPEFCKKALAEARRLIPIVKTRGPDDTRISGGAQALFHTAASCFARAGDCDAAWSTYRELFPNASSPATPEVAAMMPQIVRDAYDSSILFCGAEKRGPARAEPPPPPPK